MGTLVIAAQSDLSVEPGSSTSTELRVRNNGTVVDQLTFQPLGDHTSWIKVEPPLVRLFPGTEETVILTIAPPCEPTSTSGTSVWGVKAMSQEDPADSSVAEGTVDVAEFGRLEAELVPTTGHGRFRGTFRVAVDNLGNVDLPVRMTGSDSEALLEFDVGDPALDLEPGSARFTKVKIRPPKRIWRGSAKSFPFELLVEPQIVGTAPDDAAGDDSSGDGPSGPPPPSPGGTAVAERTLVVESTTLSGTYIQVPILPKWFLKAALALTALLLALWIAWQLLVKPNVESAAREVAIEEVEEVADEVETLDEEVAEVAEEVDEVADDAADDVAALEDDIESGDVAPEGSGAGGDGNGSLGGTLNDASVATTFRVVVPIGAGSDDEVRGPVVENGHLFALTDMVLQNPGNDTGQLQIKVGADTLYEVPLQSFRTLDFHTIAPHVVPAGETVSVSVRCDPGPVPDTPACSSAVLFSGFMTPLDAASADA